MRTHHRPPAPTSADHRAQLIDAVTAIHASHPRMTSIPSPTASTQSRHPIDAVPDHDRPRHRYRPDPSAHPSMLARMAKHTARKCPSTGRHCSSCRSGFTPRSLACRRSSSQSAAAHSKQDVVSEANRIARENVAGDLRPHGDRCGSQAHHILRGLAAMRSSVASPKPMSRT